MRNSQDSPLLYWWEAFKKKNSNKKMAVVRGSHNSPGIYTKIKDNRKTVSKRNTQKPIGKYTSQAVPIIPTWVIGMALPGTLRANEV